MRVLKALEDNNIEIEAIGGTSAGSIVATLYAMGYKPYYIYTLFKRYAQEIINIGKAVRASSSFPAFFCPCEYKKHIFMDGGVLDNTPVLPLKQIYDKKVIAVNFESDPVEENCDVMDIIMKTLDIMGNKISEKSLEQSDLILTVPTDRAGLFDIDKLDKCYKFGYDTVVKNIDKIKDCQ